MNMTERLRSGSCTNSANLSAKMANDLTPRKTMVIVVIVVGCFAVLWPKVFYPILVGSANKHIKPSPIDKTTGCCDVISETDVNTIKIMSELCRTIIKRDEDTPLTGREIVAKCQSAVLETCGIDISAVLQEQVRLGQSFKQILDEVRSLNGSLCLKYNFGLAPWRLGVPHRVTVKVSPSSNLRQERPLRLRSELVHPAFRERGRAIPQPQSVTRSRPAPRIVEGRPGPLPGMRPTLGGAGHVVPPPKQGTGTMGLIMPIYTVGIVIFFTYTIMKIVFKKQPEALYPPVEPDPTFRKEVFESERSHVGPKLTREGVSSKLVVNAMSALLDEVDQEIESRRKASEVAEQDVVANGKVVKPQEEEQPTVKVLGMEMTASCEGGKKWSRPESPVVPSASPPPAEPVEPPQEIFLEGALPAQSHLLVADAATEAQKATSEEDPAVVLAGKMTLSVISLDSSENGTDESSNSGGRKPEERSSSNISEEFEKIETDIQLEDQIDDIIGEARNLVPKSEEFDLLQEIENDIREINSKSQLSEPLEVDEIDNIENQIISKYLGTDLGEIGKEFVEKELLETVKEQLEKEIDESDIKSTVAIEQLEFEALKTEESKVVDSGISEQQKEAEPDKIVSELDKTDVKGEVSQEPISAITDISAVVSEEKEQILAVEKIATEDVGAKAETVSLEADARDIAPTGEEIVSKQESQIEKELAEASQADIAAVASNITEIEKDIVVAPVPASQLEELSDLVEKKLEPEVKSDDVEDEPKLVEAIKEVDSKKEIVETPVPASNSETVLEEKSNNVEQVQASASTSQLAELSSLAEDIRPEEKSSNDKPITSQLVGAIKTVEDKRPLEKVSDELDPVQQHKSAEEKDTFTKLNEAIAALHSEFRRTEEEKPTERLAASDESPADPEEEEEEEIEYEYEVSDDEGVGEDIRNVYRIEESADNRVIEHLNGDDQEQSKYGTTSSATLAENDISDEEDLGNEDEEEEIEEIIEYVTDDEEEEEEIEQPGERNNVNHVNNRTNAHE